MPTYLEPAERARLIEKYMPFARNVAGQIAPTIPNLEMDDAIQQAQEGLIWAANRFDVAKHDPDHESGADLDTNFKSYAYLRIRGAVIDEARRNNFVRRRGREKGIVIHFASLDSLVESDDSTKRHSIELTDIEADNDLIMDFENALKVLDDRERRIVLSLAAGAKGKELADEFEVSESRISQLATEARIKLERRMGVIE